MVQSLYTISTKEVFVMGLFQSDNPKEKNHKGILGAFSVDVIKWEPEDAEEAAIICHKYEYEDFPNGSYLIVGPAQMAIFTNNMAAGDSVGGDYSGAAQMSVFRGPCKIKLETGDSRFAPFRNVSHGLTGGESAFHSTVFFINTTYMNELNWGTQSPFVVNDPEEDVQIHVRSFGLFGVHIEQNDDALSAVQARKFLQKVVGTRADYTRDELIDFMRAKILEYVPNLLANAMIKNNVGILKISAYLSEFSKTIFEQLIEHFDGFGLTLDNFSFHNISAPDEDLRIINEAKIQKRKAQLEAEGTARQMDIESEAMARKRQREGYTYQQEAGFQVMSEAARNEGPSSTLMGAGMGLGMGFGVGGAFNQGMQSIAQNTMNFSNQPPTNTAAPAAAAAPKILCKNCGSELQEGAKFCMNCGEKVVLGTVCPDCGATIPEGAKFCMNCGKKMVSVCPECGCELSPGAKFCPECGTGL